jgi:hypothetical protein
MEVAKMSIVKATNKKSGITYVYESESYWDKEKKQPRNKRKLIGKIDEQTGEIIPTRGNRRIDDTDASPKTDTELQHLNCVYKKQIASQEALIRSQTDEIAKMKAEKMEMARRLMELAKNYGA